MTARSAIAIAVAIAVGQGAMIGTPAAAAVPDPVAATVARCPDASLTADPRLMVDPWCDAYAAGLLAALAGALERGAGGRPELPVTYVLPPDRAARMLGRHAVTERGCWLGRGPDGVDPATRVDGRLSLGALTRTDCRAVPAPWQARVAGEPAVHGVVVATLGALRHLAVGLARLDDEARRLSGMFGRPRVAPRIDNPNLAFVDRVAVLSAEALDLAALGREVSARLAAWFGTDGTAGVPPWVGRFHSVAAGRDSPDAVAAALRRALTGR